MDNPVGFYENKQKKRRSFISDTESIHYSFVIRKAAAPELVKRKRVNKETQCVLSPESPAAHIASSEELLLMDVDPC